MKADIILACKEKILIIDTKYYGKYFRNHFEGGSSKFISGNLYQIFCYVKNKALELKNWEVSGLLLYAQTDEEPVRQTYLMSGNEIGIQSIDLNTNFDEIKSHLNSIAKGFSV